MNHSYPRPIPESYWVIPGILLAGAYPGEFDPDRTRFKLIQLLNEGMDTFINLTNEDELPDYRSILQEEAEQYDRDVNYERFSISDRGLPSIKKMRSILDAIDDAIQARHKLYLHCWGGIGRTGTTVGCFLVRHGLSGEEALNKLAELYLESAQSRIYPRSPETQEQIRFILNWHES
jgi:protein tyrosine/serine phosphatase